MPFFSNTSKRRLRTCHPDLQVLMKWVIQFIDITIVWGYRGKESQNEAFRNGFSKKKYPGSKHNITIIVGKIKKPESKAVDAVPCPVDWENVARMRFFAGIIIGIAIWLKQTGRMKYCIRWGGDWDSDTVLKDQRFDDLAHFELTTKKLY